MNRYSCAILAFCILSKVVSSYAAAKEGVPLFNGKDLSGWIYPFDQPDVKMQDV